MCVYIEILTMSSFIPGYNGRYAETSARFSNKFRGNSSADFDWQWWETNDDDDSNDNELNVQVQKTNLEINWSDTNSFLFQLLKVSRFLKMRKSSVISWRMCLVSSVIHHTLLSIARSWKLIHVISHTLYCSQQAATICSYKIKKLQLSSKICTRSWSLCW